MSQYNSTVNINRGGSSPPAFYYLPYVDRPINPRDPLNLLEEVDFQGDVIVQKQQQQQQNFVNRDVATPTVSRKRSFVADEDTVEQPYKKRPLFVVETSVSRSDRAQNMTPTKVDDQVTKKITVEQYQERRRALKRKRDEMSSSSSLDIRRVQNNKNTSSPPGGGNEEGFEF